MKKNLLQIGFNKNILAVLILLLMAIVAGVAAYLRAYPVESLQYFYLDCTIYDKSGKVLFYNSKYNDCAFKDDGSFLAGNELKSQLAFYDKNDGLVWETAEHIHHDVNFTSDQKNILIMTSEFISLKGEKVRSDCFSVRNLQNQMLKQWCLSENIKKLRSLGIQVGKSAPAENIGGAALDINEISHANSFYEIPENILSQSDPAFKKGNYIINVFGLTGAVLILDSDLKNILWHKDMSKFKGKNMMFNILTHDLQVLYNGNILAYFNKSTVIEPDVSSCEYQPVDLKHIRQLYDKAVSGIKKTCPVAMWSSRLVEFNPYTGKIEWQYIPKKIEDFQSEIMGSVTKLDSQNYLYSDITRGGKAFVIRRDGQVQWSFINPVYDSKREQPFTFRSIKPMKDISFLVERGLVSRSWAFNLF